MAVYWLAYRIAPDPYYEERRAALMDAVLEVKTLWWVESPGFILFDSAYAIDRLADIVAGSLEPRDLAVLGMTEFMAARIIGTVRDRDLLHLLPHAPLS